MFFLHNLIENVVFRAKTFKKQEKYYKLIKLY